MSGLWRSVFGNDRPVEVEIGPGTGTFLLAAAARWPRTNFYGIEHSRSRAARLCTAIETRALSNARVLHADAACIVSTMLPAESVAAFHIYFPDPWWKRRHHRRRLITPALAAALSHTLAPGGRLYLATDVNEVFTLALHTLEAIATLARRTDLSSPRPGITAFERKGLARGARILEASFVKHAGHNHVAPSTNKAAPITPAESPS
jgi:tRNA (guanine-N7-)-methyltransferase